jgi:hypothetical protein
LPGAKSGDNQLIYLLDGFDFLVDATLVGRFVGGLDMDKNDVVFLQRSECPLALRRVVVAVIIKTGSIAYTQKMAETFIADACNSLDSLPPLKYKELLVDWAHFCITRNS